MLSTMPALGSNINVNATCLRVLRQLGFELRIESDNPDADLLECSWVAEKSGYDLVADNPIELLGLAAIYEHKKPFGPPVPYWWTVEGDDIQAELMEAKWPDDDD